MQFRMLAIACLTLTLTSFGCDKKQTEQPSNDEAQAEAPADKEEKAEAPSDDEEGAEPADTKPEKVEVAKAGTKFDPAVEAEQLPAGAWYCDMGTVHWAGMEKPEGGKCPECNMALKQHDPEKLAAQKEKAVEAHEHGDEGHDHGDGDHAHEGDDHGHDHGEESHGHAH